MTKTLLNHWTVATYQQGSAKASMPHAHGASPTSIDAMIRMKRGTLHYGTNMCVLTKHSIKTYMGY